MKIKAEAIDDDYYSFVSGLFTMLACAVSVFSLMVSLTDLLKDCERMITIIMLAIVIIIATGYLTIRLGIGLVKHSVCRKWRPYILIAVEEVEEELRKIRNSIARICWYQRVISLMLSPLFNVE